MIVKNMAYSYEPAGEHHFKKSILSFANVGANQACSQPWTTWQNGWRTWIVPAVGNPRRDRDHAGKKETSTAAQKIGLRPLDWP